MLLKLIYIKFILSTFTLYSYGAHISEFNETKLILSINSRLSALKENLTNSLKELDQWSSSSSLHNCIEAKSSGIYDIVIPNFSNQSFKAACDAETREGGWTIILRRMDGSVNFHRNWTEYKNGFGNLNGEYFLGMDKIHALTLERRQELLVLLEDFEGDQRFETYDEFAIGGEHQQYELQILGEANGTAGNSLWYHLGRKFSTFDNDNNSWQYGNCAIPCTGAWWYRNCQTSQLTGTNRDNGLDRGVT